MKLAWYRVASHLRIPVQELRERITHEEFLDWLEFVGRAEANERKTEHYLAQIAAQVAKTRAKHPNQVKTENFLLRTVDPMDQDRMQKSKFAWGSLVGLDLTKN